MNSLLFIGAGSMGSAILGQVVSRGVLDVSRLAAYDIDGSRLEAPGKLGVRLLESLDETGRFDAVLLAVKPKDVPSVCAKLPGLMAENGLVVSIAAGVTIGSIEGWIGRPTAVSRVMPNINLLSASGMSAASFNASADAEQKKLVLDIFSSVGDVIEVDESKLNAVTGLSGSGPAYAALFISALTDGGVKSGLTNAEAYRLALQTVGGTVETLRKLGCVPEQLKNMVSSPGGTTIDAVHSLEKNRFRAAVIDAVETATHKAELLGAKGAKK